MMTAGLHSWPFNRLFYRLLRAELALIVIQDAAVREQLEGLPHRYDAELQERGGGELHWFS